MNFSDNCTTQFSLFVISSVLFKSEMPHVLVTGTVDRPEAKVFGLSQKDLKCIANFIQPSGSRVGQDGQAFHYPPTQVIDVLQFALRYSLVACSTHTGNNSMIWTMHRPFN